MRKTRLATLVSAALLATACSSDPAPPATPRTTQPPSASPSTVTPTPNPYDSLSTTELGSRLLEAAARGRTTEVSQLLDAGARTEVRDGRRRTPLLLAVTRDRVGAARALVKAGADPDALDDRHDTPWLVTGVTGSVAMAKVVLEADPDLTIRNRFGGLSHIPASERGHDDYVAYVLDHTDIAVDHVNDLGWTALLEAVILGKGTRPWQRIVESLVDHGADVSIADRAGVTPLEHARRRGHAAIARILERA
ncbi:ankyrin repeat domain-containing protein [Aeromicrobium sp. NPDC092404]|uniref:ankyrin repeat domain-containing protein n=1 Tax=Aeromicrobium sp. NPDC092404 TaxID=3154976 RepID=UPI003425A121